MLVVDVEHVRVRVTATNVLHLCCFMHQFALHHKTLVGLLALMLAGIALFSLFGLQTSDSDYSTSYSAKSYAVPDFALTFDYPSDWTVEQPNPALVTWEVKFSSPDLRQVSLYTGGDFPVDFIKRGAYITLFHHSGGGEEQLRKFQDTIAQYRARVENKDISGKSGFIVENEPYIHRVVNQRIEVEAFFVGGNEDLFKMVLTTSPRELEKYKAIFHQILSSIQPI